MSNRRSKKAEILSWAMMVMLVFMTGTAWALPDGGSVVSGSDAPVVDGRTMTINQTAEKSIINWDSYNIAKRETVAYTGQDTTWISLNRVTGGDPSQILGQITADGAVWVINPNGLLVGSSAKINVGSFLGSTLGIANDDFNAGTYTFADGGSSITNQGKITTADGGYVALLAPSITNKGTITTPAGATLLGSGTDITLDLGSFNITIDTETAAEALGIVNSGKIYADGGKVILSAESAGDLFKTVINNTGVIQARTIENEPTGGVGFSPYTTGYIYLLGNANDSNAIYLGGTLDASAPNGGDGGRIETSAAKVSVANSANISTNAPDGTTGWWYIDPAEFNVAASGGNITGSTLGKTLGKTNVYIETDHPGSINVNQAVSWSSNNTLSLYADEYINVNKNITASGKSARLVLNNDDGSFPEAPVGDPPGAPVYFLQLNNGSVITLSGSEATLAILGEEYTVINSANVRFLDFETNAPDLNGNYALGTNINASITSGWNDGAGFTPIGTEGDPFTGNFTGLGHTISNLTINRPDAEGVGLFGYNNGMISNVGLTGGSVTGREDVGALAGKNMSDCLIFNSYASTKVTGTDEVGGLVGENEGWIVNSYATGAVSGINYNDGSVVYNEGIGGLVGDNDGMIVNSYATGAVSGYYKVGGLVGGNDGVIDGSYAAGKITGINYIEDNAYNEDIGGLVGENTNKIVNSYATGVVNGYEDVGGLVGDNDHGVVENSYAAGKVSGVEYVGGLVGWNEGMIQNSYAVGAVTGNYTVGGLVGENDEGMITRSYATGTVTGISYFYNDGWDYGSYDSENIGGLVGWNGGMVEDSFATGKVNGTYDVGGLVGDNSDMIVSSYATGKVTGISDVGGLVGGNGGMITESYATGKVTGNEDVGGLVGENGGTITKSYATGKVTGDEDVGGLVGLNYNGDIIDTHADGNVTGASHYIGGLVGYNDLDSLILNSYSIGKVSGNSSVGGLVGYNSGDIINTDAWGNITGKEAVGGLVGFNDHDSLIVNSYSIGKVSGNSSVGGLVGHNNNSVIISSYWDMTTSGTIVGVGSSNGNILPEEVTGLDTPAMMQESSFEGWDFDNVWYIEEGVTYPLLGVLTP